jgi:hypothetical protein
MMNSDQKITHNGHKVDDVFVSDLFTDEVVVVTVSVICQYLLLLYVF